MRNGTEPVFRDIEAYREELVAREEPLVTGDLGDVVSWDRDSTVAQAAKASRTPRHARYLYGLIRAIRPKKVLELGTNVGISGAYTAAALKANGDGGMLITMDLSAYRQRLASRLFDKLALDNVECVLGDFAATFDPTMESSGPFDFAFIDGNHQLEPTLYYTNAICDTASGPVDILFDDIRWSDGMIEAWRRLSADPRMAAAVDLHHVALGTMIQSHDGVPSVTPPLRGEFL